LRRIVDHQDGDVDMSLLRVGMSYRF